MKGTTILVGLLCRSAVVLEEETLEIGITPQRLSGEWVQELDEALEQEVDRWIAGDDYKEACLLSELKSKFLYAPMSEVHRKNRGRGPARPTAPSHDDIGGQRDRGRSTRDGACERQPRKTRRLEGLALGPPRRVERSGLFGFPRAGSRRSPPLRPGPRTLWQRSARSRVAFICRAGRAAAKARAPLSSERSTKVVRAGGPS